MMGNRNALGYKHTEEARAKMKGRKDTPEQSAKRSVAMKGNKNSLGKNIGNQYAFGKNLGKIPWNKGKVHSPETIEKMRITRMAVVALKRVQIQMTALVDQARLERNNDANR